MKLMQFPMIKVEKKSQPPLLYDSLRLCVKWLCQVILGPLRHVVIFSEVIWMFRSREKWKTILWVLEVKVYFIEENFQKIISTAPSLWIIEVMCKKTMPGYSWSSSSCRDLFRSHLNIQIKRKMKNNFLEPVV
jgi:hypothetical protein